MYLYLYLYIYTYVDSCMFVYIYVWLLAGMLDGFSGLTEVAIYPMCTSSLQSVAVLAACNTGSDRHMGASYLTILQATKAIPLKVPKVTLSTYSWTNKEHFPFWL